MRTALIQGSGGVGSALARVVIEAGEFDQVILAGRGQWSVESAESQIRTLPLDVTSDHSLTQAAEQVMSWCDRLHLVVTTAGVLTDTQHGVTPEKKLTELTREAFHQVMDINCVGPFLWLKALYPLIKHRDPVTIATLSARVGSISDNRLGGWYSYRASKAALNQYLRCMAIELARYNPDAAVAALHPGTVDTALSKPFQTHVAPHKLQDPAMTAAQLWAVLDRLQPAESGRFFAYDGSEIEF